MLHAFGIDRVGNLTVNHLLSWVRENWKRCFSYSFDDVEQSVPSAKIVIKGQIVSHIDHYQGKVRYLLGGGGGEGGREGGREGYQWNFGVMGDGQGF